MTIIYPESKSKLCFLGRHFLARWIFCTKLSGLN